VERAVADPEKILQSAGIVQERVDRGRDARITVEGKTVEVRTGVRVELEGVLGIGVRAQGVVGFEIFR
jgi:hypothetical protein